MKFKKEPTMKCAIFTVTYKPESNATSSVCRTHIDTNAMDNIRWNLTKKNVYNDPGQNERQQIKDIQQRIQPQTKVPTDRS